MMPRSLTSASTKKPTSSAYVWWLPTNSIGRASGTAPRPRCAPPRARLSARGAT